MFFSEDGRSVTHPIVGVDVVDVNDDSDDATMKYFDNNIPFNLSSEDKSDAYGYVRD